MSFDDILKHMNLLERYIKEILAEDLESFLQDTKGIYYTEYSDDAAVKSGGKDVKKIWAKNVDRSFIQSLVKVHWINVPEISRFQRLLKASGRDEISASGYLPGMKLRSNWSDFGVTIDGHVTLAANNMNAIYSGFSYEQAKDIKPMGSGMPKRSGSFRGETSQAKQYILDSKSFDSNQVVHNELLVDNWKVTGLVLPIDAKGAMDSPNKQFFSTMAKIADAAGLKIYNHDMKTFTLEQVVNSA